MRFHQNNSQAQDLRIHLESNLHEKKSGSMQHSAAVQQFLLEHKGHEYESVRIQGCFHIPQTA